MKRLETKSRQAWAVEVSGWMEERSLRERLKAMGVVYKAETPGSQGPSTLTAWGSASLVSPIQGKLMDVL